MFRTGSPLLPISLSSTPPSIRLSSRCFNPPTNSIVCVYPYVLTSPCIEGKRGCAHPVAPGLLRRKMSAVVCIQVFYVSGGIYSVILLFREKTHSMWRLHFASKFLLSPLDGGKKESDFFLFSSPPSRPRYHFQDLFASTPKNKRGKRGKRSTISLIISRSAEQKQTNKKADESKQKVSWWE